MNLVTRANRVGVTLTAPRCAECRAVRAARSCDPAKIFLVERVVVSCHCCGPLWRPRPASRGQTRSRQPTAIHRDVACGGGGHRSDRRPVAVPHCWREIKAALQIDLRLCLRLAPLRSASPRTLPYCLSYLLAGARDRCPTEPAEPRAHTIPPKPVSVRQRGPLHSSTHPHGGPEQGKAGPVGCSTLGTAAARTRATPRGVVRFDPGHPASQSASHGGKHSCTARMPPCTAPPRPRRQAMQPRG